MTNDKNSLILLGIILFLVLTIAFGIGWLVVSGGQNNDNDQIVSGKLNGSRQYKTYTIAGDPIVSNLNTGTLRDRRAVRVKAQLKVADDKIVRELETKNAEIVDTIISILRAKTPDEMIKPDAKEIVKNEIVENLNETFYTDKILDVFFEEFIVQ